MNGIMVRADDSYLATALAFGEFSHLIESPIADHSRLIGTKVKLVLVQVS